MPSGSWICLLGALAVFALTVLPASAILDKDGNGISDLVESVWNSGTLPATPYDPAADPDGDTWNNATEATAGTNPFSGSPADYGMLTTVSEIVPATYTDEDNDGVPELATPETLVLTWTSVPGKAYQVWFSSTLAPASWMPVSDPLVATGTELGKAIPLTQPDGSIPDKLFVRVSIADTDSDGDDLTDYEESIVDTKPDDKTTIAGISDSWLAAHFTSTLLNVGISAINPNADPDGDGTTIVEECLEGTDPNTAEPPSDRNWIAVTGDAGDGAIVTREGTLVIPAGKSALLVIATASDEYPYWTGDNSQYNDILTWDIRPTGSPILTGNIDVNSRNTAWQHEELLGSSLQGFFPAHIEKLAVYKAPPENGLPVEITLTAMNVDDDLLPSTTIVGLLQLEINEVDFAGEKYWELRSDDLSKTYSAPQWRDTNGDGDAEDCSQGEHNNAVGYSRGTKPRFGGKFKIGSAPILNTIMMKAKGPDGIEIPETEASVNGDEVSLELTEATPFPNTILHYARNDATAFKLNWEMRIGNSECVEIGNTKHTLYVTHGDPVTALRQETLFEIGCRTAKNLDLPSQITNAIWNQFATKKVTRVDGTPLKYYQVFDCDGISTTDLLKLGDGQCGAWVKFFIDIRRVQSIDDQPWVLVTPLAGTDHGLLVKNWDFSGTGTSTVANYPFFNIPGIPNHIDIDSYRWRYKEVSDVVGIPGQGIVDNPDSMFEGHSLALIDGEYYDPSYGVKYGTFPEVETNISGFYHHPGNVYPGHMLVDEPDVNLDLNGNGNKTDLQVSTWVIAFRRNLPGLDLTEAFPHYPKN